MTAMTTATFFPPVMEARRWLEGVHFSPERPLLNVSQAAPLDPPPEALREEMARLVRDIPDVHLYGPVLGLPELRAEIASQFGAAYGGEILPEEVAITAGCNQAFAAAISALAGPGDAVILPAPWYFNHKMWLDMAGIETHPLMTGPDMLPDVEIARALLTPRTKAIVLVTPNNPGGVEYPAELVADFAALAREAGIALVIDETYRDFDARSGAPHPLFTDPDWRDTVIQLYSFSKTYRLTGHRTGAMIASRARLAEAEKFLDTVTICPAQLGQHAALWGMRNLGQWVAGERAEILARRAAVANAAPALEREGWRLMGLGAYFAWVEHPFALPSDALCREMVRAAGVLALPGTMFMPEGAEAGQHQFRIAFANVDESGITTLAERLSALSFDPRSA